MNEENVCSEQSELEKISQLFQNHINELTEGVYLIENRLHSLKNTTVPEKLSDVPVPSPAQDFISDMRIKLSQLNGLRERIFLIHDKIRGII